MVAFLLFGFLSAVQQYYANTGDETGDRRIVTTNRLTITQPVPMVYHSYMAQAEGVEAVSRQSWFGGYFKEVKNKFAHYAVDPESYAKLFPELQISAETLERWESTKDGILVTPGLAANNGWQVGDKIPIQSYIWPSKPNQFTWYFTLVGITEAASMQQERVLMRFDYYEENNLYWEGNVDEILALASPTTDVDQVASNIDDIFVDQRVATRSRPELLFKAQFNKRYEALEQVIVFVTVAVLLTILLVTSNNISTSVKERIGEYSVMQVLGFSPKTIILTIVAEVFTLITVAGMCGLALAKICIEAIAPQFLSFSELQNITINNQSFVTSIALILFISAIGVLAPTLRVRQPQIAQVLRGNK
jgi:putative ABC transport system permease protein